ncbi:MAG: tyrosine-type recombinase/integrase [Thermodesulfobacteriota bacterium]
MQILSYLPQFREYLSVLLGRRPGTVTRYCRAVESFTEWFGSRGGSGGNAEPNVRSITRDDIEAWMKHLFLHQGNIKNISRAAKLSALKAFWRFLVYKGVIKEDPLTLIPSPKVTRPMPQKFSTLQLKQIFSGPDLSTDRGVRDMAILKVLYASGPRVDEIRSLSVEDLRTSGGDIYLYYHGKGGKERVVRLRRNPSEALRRWLVVRERYINSEDPDSARSLFVSMSYNSRGRRLSVQAYNAVLKKYAALVGIRNERVFTHKMRATFATDLYDMGFGLIEISNLLGHESVETTQLYIAISEKALKKTAIPDKRWRELERKGGEDE